jgi:hypothetical protein
MEITGHKTESSFLRYIQETRTPQAPEIFKVFEGIKLKWLLNISFNNLLIKKLLTDESKEIYREN